MLQDSAIPTQFVLYYAKMVLLKIPDFLLYVPSINEDLQNDNVEGLSFVIIIYESNAKRTITYTQDEEFALMSILQDEAKLLLFELLLLEIIYKEVTEGNKRDINLVLLASDYERLYSFGLSFVDTFIHMLKNVCIRNFTLNVPKNCFVARIWIEMFKKLLQLWNESYEHTLNVFCITSIVGC